MIALVTIYHTKRKDERYVIRENYVNWFEDFYCRNSFQVWVHLLINLDNNNINSNIKCVKCNTREYHSLVFYSETLLKYFFLFFNSTVLLKTGPNFFSLNLKILHTTAWVQEQWEGLYPAHPLQSNFIVGYQRRSNFIVYTPWFLTLGLLDIAILPLVIDGEVSSANG